MKRLLFGFFCVLFCGAAQSAQIVNVEYIHKLIEQEHGITVPYNSELHDPTVAANMKYLLTTIDVANQMLSGESITDYGNSEYATTVATDTVATLEMVRDHVRNYKFFATTTPDTTSFSFTISASGVFHIDWGDGTRESYRKTNTTATTYSHEYADAGEYVIKIGGYRTGGNSLSFANNLNLAKIDGSVGAIFSTIKNKNGTVSNPNFQDLFSGCTNLTGTIPPDLFKGIYGTHVLYMFYNTFKDCSGLTGNIPDKLFSELSGNVSHCSFGSTFSGCSGLTGSIPNKLFGNTYGANTHAYNSTFSGCSGLTGTIPDDLFGDLSSVSTSARYIGLFNSTFLGCNGLTGAIPVNLFKGYAGVLEFYRTFANTGITEIPEKLFESTFEKPVSCYFAHTFDGCTHLKNIPQDLFAGCTGTQNDMFFETFRNCYSLTKIPDGLFYTINGESKVRMYYATFQNCTGLTGSIPENLFGEISGTLAWNAFIYTFINCKNLTGTSAKMNGEYLYNIWPDTTYAGGMYRGCTGLTDYADIPSNWK